MSKEASLFLVDAGHSMDKMHTDTASFLKTSLQCLIIKLQQTVFNTSNHEIGFAIFGDKQHDDNDDNSLMLQPIKKPDLELIRKVLQLSEAKLQNQKPGGDIFQAIRYGIDKLQSHCGKKNQTRRLFLFSHGMGETSYNEFTIKELTKQLKLQDVKLNVIPIGFMQGYDFEQNRVENEYMHMNQLTNAQLLMDMKEDAQDNMQIFPDLIAVSLYRRFRKRDVNPVALFRGNLEISQDLAIPVQTYKMIRRQRLKSLAKYDMLQPFNQYIDKTKQVVTEISYIVQGDETNTKIETENRQNAYAYGQHLVPISDILERQIKFYEDKCLKILGFVDKSKISRYAFLGEVEMVVPNKGRQNKPAQKLFTALIYSMITLSKYAIARYIPRNSKNGVAPRLVVLIPNRTVERQGLYLIELPMVEDVRDYPFNSLKKCTEKQQQLVKEMVANMILYRKNDDDEKEQLKIENTFNPTRQYFFQAIFYRALSEDGELPPLDPVIKRYLTPEEKIFEGTQEQMKSFRKEFKLVKKELAKDKAKKNTVGWKEIMENQMPAIEEKSQLSETGEDLKPNKLFGPDDEDNEHFDPAKPILSFNKMLTNNKIDLVDLALEQLTGYIKNKVGTAFSEEALDHLVQCASNLRRGCDEQKEGEYWDDWLERCESNLGFKLFQKIKKEGLGYLQRSNKDLFKADKLTVLEPEVEPEIDGLD